MLEIFRFRFPPWDFAPGEPPPVNETNPPKAPVNETRLGPIEKPKDRCENDRSCLADEAHRAVQ